MSVDKVSSEIPHPVTAPRPQSDKLSKSIAVAVAAVLIIFCLFLVLSPATSPFSSIRDSDGDGYPDSTDPFPDDPFNGAEPILLVPFESWNGFNAICMRSNLSVKYDDLLIRVSSDGAEAPWDDFCEPGLLGGYVAIDAGHRELGDLSIVLIIYDNQSDGRVGLGDYFYFKFDEAPPSGLTCEVTFLRESTNSVVASFSCTIP